MAKFEESHPRHIVHELHKPEGHGYVDQKYGKGNLSPIRNSVPSIESGSMPGANGAGAPGEAPGAGPSGAM
jgi:hypothetical protein